MFSRIREQLNSKLIEYSSAKAAVQSERSSLKQSRKTLTRSSKALEIVQTVAQKVQQSAHKKIASVVSRCLEAVFDDPYRFRITFEKKRGKTEAKLRFVKGDSERVPLKGSGGGVADVASFALRLACMALSKPRVRRLLVLDEPFKGIHSPVYRQRACEMLEQLAEEMEVQIILVTGVEEFRTGKIIEIR